MDRIEKTLSPLIERQFPQFYRTDGPIFVAFVKEYYKWLEGKQRIACPIYLSLHNGTCSVVAGSANVVGYNSNFSEKFKEGGEIAIYKDTEDKDYEIFKIETISNNSFLTLSSEKVPSFSAANVRYCFVRDNENPLYHGRRIYDYRDIDNTVDNFLIHFKETYLKNIQFDTNTNIRLLVKHALDIYRAKGTERAVDLLFKIVFGVPATIYYPGDDVWKLSDGHWYQPRYLEISLHKDAANFVNKQITGMTSGATAFVESCIRRTVKGRFIDVLYISAINGEFITGEKINAPDSGIRTPEAPTIIGSLTNLEVDQIGSGAGYSVGDIVNLYSESGEQGQARVTSISDITGLVSFDLEHGGYGYTTNSQVIISNSVLTISNITIDANNTTLEYFNLFDTVYQPLASIEITGANGSFVPQTNVYTYHANNDVKGVGKVLNATSSLLRVSVLSGNLDSDVIYSEANAAAANIVSFNDETVSANVVGYSANVRMDVIDRIGVFENGEQVYQLDMSGKEIANAVLVSYSTTIGANGVIRLSNTSGIFYPNKTLIGRKTGATANVKNVIVQLGVFNATDEFDANTGNFIYAVGSGTSGTVTAVSDGEGATVGFSNTLLYTENVEINTDYVRDYLNVALDAVSFGFPAYPSGNLTHGTIDQMLTYTEYTIGKIAGLTGINQGSDYTAAPIVRVFEPVTYSYRRNNILAEITGTDGNFAVGELVTQEATGARGLVISANATHMEIENLRLLTINDFVPTVNASTVIVGDSSATTANVISAIEKTDANYMGLNAIIDAEVAAAEGAVTGLDVYDSGFGYQEGELITFSKPGLTEGSAYAVLGKHGRAKGYYRRQGGFLSSTKKIHDGYYYQEYSYEVRSSVTLNKYADMLKQLLHVAGTKAFAAYVLSSTANTNVNILNTKITQE